MAANAQRVGKTRVSYDILHNLSSVDILFDTKKKKRKQASKSLGFFEAERVVTSRQDSEVRILTSMILSVICTE